MFFLPVGRDRMLKRLPRGPAAGTIQSLRWLARAPHLVGEGPALARARRRRVGARSTDIVIAAAMAAIG
jgi:hypothetical protein